MKKLICASCVSVVFIALELYGGYLAGSIAVFADSAHLGSDILGFAISMIALKLAQKSKSDSLSFGWHRAEIIGTLISVCTMWIMTIWLVVEATHRFYEEPEVEGLTMLIVAIISLFFNLIQIYILHQGDGHYHLGGDHHDHGHGGCHGHGDDKKHDHTHDHHDHKHDTENPHHHHTNDPAQCDHQRPTEDQLQISARGINEEITLVAVQKPQSEAPQDQIISSDQKDGGSKDKASKKRRNINIDAAMLHVLGDCIMSIGIIIAAAIIYIWPQAWRVDPICTYLFAVIVMFTTFPVTKRCMQVLMEGTPEAFDTKLLVKDIWALNDLGDKDVLDVHDLHVWSISVGKLAMTVHLKSRQPLKTLGEVTDLCRRKYNLNHTVIQVEGPVDTNENPHHFDCENDLHDL